MMETINITINGQPVDAYSNETILEAAQRASIDIPNLCAYPNLDAFGACRMCIVKVEGLRGYPTACTTPVKAGMIITTETPELTQLRQNILKLLLSGHTSPCITCLHHSICEQVKKSPSKAGKTTKCNACSNTFSCDLKKLAERYEINSLDLAPIYKNIPVEKNDPFFERDYNLCILCGRCTRVCQKLLDHPAVDFIQRGKSSKIGTSFGESLIDSGCHFCGACIDICPTGALTETHSKWKEPPTSRAQTTCSLCNEKCQLTLHIRNNEVTSTSSISHEPNHRICAVGRFVYPQLMSHSLRIGTHQIKENTSFKQVSYDEAISQTAALLKEYPKKFACLVHSNATKEELYLSRKFTEETMQSSYYFIIPNESEQKNTLIQSILEKISAKEIKAALIFGNLLPTQDLQNLEKFILIDPYKTASHLFADVIFAPSILAEIAGTYESVRGTSKLKASIPPYKNTQPDWKIICDLGLAMGDSSFNYDSIENVQTKLGNPPPSPLDFEAFIASPLTHPENFPTSFRGHLLEEMIPDLQRLSKKGQEKIDESSELVLQAKTPELFEILEKNEIAPNIYSFKIHAPLIAGKCHPGQFVIAMANPKSERIPYTLADYHREEGWVIINVIEAGRSSQEMTRLRPHQKLAHFAGPLGKPLEIKPYGTVLCGGGCFGVGTMLPIIKAMKEAGNKVICVEEASSHYLLYWQNKLASAADEFIIATKDGSLGTKGGVQEVIDMLAARGEKIDQAFIIGCTFMMKYVSETTRKYNIPTLTAMNTLMLDGTGMCGACRVQVGNEMKFACVDGPFLDGHLIQWDELLQRSHSFHSQEVKALQQQMHTHHCQTI